MRKSFMLRFAMSSAVLISAAANAATISEAVKYAARAEKALTKNKLDEAVSQAEAAVVASPKDASYRMLLGRAYLESGRFRSAATSFADTLALDPSNGGAALSLALARIGLGDQNGARAVLDEHGNLIPASDRGLALALSGDAPGGVTLLEEAVRNGGADAKTRQNLALSYALSGRWAEARVMASYDLDPKLVSQRILEWSAFTGEGQAPAQVAALLGVWPGADSGQPFWLALNFPDRAPVRTAETAVPPPPVPMAEAPAIEVATVAAEAEALFAPASVQFAERSEIVQAIAAPRPQIAVKPEQPAARFQRAAYIRPTGGNFVVQIGAYDSVGVAQDGWNRAVRRIGALQGLTPSTATFVKGSASFVRLSVAGFGTRGAAAEFCEQLQAEGGQCFVREQAGDAPLQWAGRAVGTKIAAR